MERTITLGGVFDDGADLEIRAFSEAAMHSRAICHTVAVLRR
jgi:hypothetical protein